MYAKQVLKSVARLELSEIVQTNINYVIINKTDGLRMASDFQFS